MALTVKPSDLTSLLNQTKLSKDNNALYQFLKRQVQVLQEIADEIGGPDFTSEIEAILASRAQVKLIEPDTTIIAQNVDLANEAPLKRVCIVKDYTGNAGTNPITLVGTVDGAVNPVINTNFGVFRVYRSTKDGAFHEW